MAFSRRPVALEEFGELFEPDQAVEPILGEIDRSLVMEWLTELWAEKELAEAGLKPRRRAIFHGPPGVGKTTLAHHIGARLGLRMLALRPDRLISRYIGATGANLGSLFDAVGTANGAPIILFFDEFDSYARERRVVDQASDAERNNIVDVLLQRIEQHDGFLIAATNFPGSIDSAIWRRFEFHLKLSLPGESELKRIIARYLMPFGLPERVLAEWADAMSSASPALVRQFCECLKRQLIIGPKVGHDMSSKAVFKRVLTTIQPHPDLGKPRLWSKKTEDAAVAATPWPLPLAQDVDELEDSQEPEANRVIQFPGEGRP